MFEYNSLYLKIYGFMKIKFIDENIMVFKYKRKELIVKGKNLKAFNLLDKSLEVKGLVEGIDIKYLGETHD